MAFGSVYPAERANELTASGTGSDGSKMFQAVEDSPKLGERVEKFSIHGSELGKALSAHFLKYSDIIAE